MQHETTDLPMISVRGMSKLFGEFVALDRGELVDSRGGKIVVFGPSGIGKSSMNTKY